MVLEAERLRQGYQLVGEGPLPVCRLPTSLCVLTWQKEERTFQGPLIRVLTPFMGASTSWPNHFPKSPFPTASHWGLGFTVCIQWAGHKHSAHHSGSRADPSQMVNQNQASRAGAAGQRVQIQPNFTHTLLSHPLFPRDRAHLLT